MTLENISVDKNVLDEVVRELVGRALLRKEGDDWISLEQIVETKETETFDVDDSAPYLLNSDPEGNLTYDKHAAFDSYTYLPGQSEANRQDYTAQAEERVSEACWSAIDNAKDANERGGYHSPWEMTVDQRDDVLVFKTLFSSLWILMYDNPGYAAVVGHSKGSSVQFLKS